MRRAVSLVLTAVLALWFLVQGWLMFRRSATDGLIWLVSLNTAVTFVLLIRCHQREKP